MSSSYSSCSAVIVCSHTSLLRQQLTALPPWELRAMIVAYEFANPVDVDLDALTTAELIEVIVGAVRRRLAA